MLRNALGHKQCTTHKQTKAMLKTLKLLLPALIPSWNFFDEIAPSPRIEFTLLKTEQDTADNWQELRPKPAHIPLSMMLKRMFFNSRWNEFLFLVSCAERLMANPTQHSHDEILGRIKADIKHGHITQNATKPFLQFRLVFINREGTELQRHIAFSSPIHRYLEDSDK